MVKNTRKIEIEETLDLTQYMAFQDNPTPVRYRLVDVVYHRGTELTSGHYVAGVTRPLGARPQYECNDTDVQNWVRPVGTKNKLTIKPRGTEPYILWYVRDMSGEKRGKRKDRDEEVVQDDGLTVADRLKANPRKRVKRVL
jgi:ubiquitin C-terminal hydrolase